MIIRSNDFTPTHFVENAPAMLSSHGARTADGEILAVYIETGKDKDGNPIRALRLPEPFGDATPTVRPARQVGGVGYGGGLDIDNWAREVSASGRIAILRESHGEIWA